MHIDPHHFNFVRKEYVELHNDGYLDCVKTTDLVLSIQRMKNGHFENVVCSIVAYRVAISKLKRKDKF